MLELNRKLNNIPINEAISWKDIWGDMKKVAQKLSPKVSELLTQNMDPSELKKYEPIAKKISSQSNIGGKLDINESSSPILLDEKIDFSKLKSVAAGISVASGFGALASKLDSLLMALDSTITSKLYEMTKFELFKLDSITMAAKSAQNEWWVKPLIAVFLVAIVSYGILYAIDKIKK